MPFYTSVMFWITDYLTSRPLLGISADKRMRKTEAWCLLYHRIIVGVMSLIHFKRIGLGERTKSLSNYLP